MDVAAAVVGFIGLAGQCLQGCKFLQNFFGDTHEAPQIVQDILHELYLLVVLLEDFCRLLADVRSSLQIPDLSSTSSALNHCYDAIRRLQKFAQRHVIFASSSTQARLKNTWKKLQCAWKMSHLRRLHERLHEAKTSVEVAQANLLLALNIAQSLQLRQIHQAIITGLAKQTAQVDEILRSHLRENRLYGSILPRSIDSAERGVVITTQGSGSETSSPGQVNTCHRRAVESTQVLHRTGPSISTALNARNLRLLCNIRTKWTSKLADHLSYDACERIVTLYDPNLSSTTSATPDLVEETLLTLAILFPNADSGLRRAPSTPATGPFPSNFDEFQHWGDRLRSLQDVVESQTPHTLRMMWHDRRNITQWYTFWVATGIGASTVFFGLVQTVTAIVHISQLATVRA